MPGQLPRTTPTAAATDTTRAEREGAAAAEKRNRVDIDHLVRKWAQERTAANNTMKLATALLLTKLVGNESKTSSKLRYSEDSVDGEHEPSPLSSSTPEAQLPSKNLKRSRLLRNHEGGSLDEGILGSGAPRNLQAVCEPGFINCVNGYVEGSKPPVSCKDECQSTGTPLCCIGGNGEPPYDNSYYYACTGFTGMICPDGSCNGTSACAYSTIPEVVDSCVGYDSCYVAGYAKEGAATSVGSMNGSCKGRRSCAGLAYATNATSNTIGNITNSCLGEFSCIDIAYANVTAHPGLAGSESSVESILDSCQGVGSCAFMAGGGRVGDVASSCNGVDACFDAGGIYGGMGSISSSCNAVDACESAGYGMDNEIETSLINCCNIESECFGINSTTVPASCSTLSPTSSPSASPSGAPTSSPTSEPTGSPSEFNDRAHIDVLVPGTLAISDNTPETKGLEARQAQAGSADSVDDVFITTISDIVTGELDPNTQRLADVIITSRNQTTVECDLLLSEACSSTCAEQAAISTMAATVTMEIEDSIADGSFTTNLQTNAEECAAEACRSLESTSVDGGAFEEPIVTFETTAPTLSPSSFLPPPTSDTGTSAPTYAKSGKTKKKGKDAKSAKSESSESAKSTKSAKLLKLETKDEVMRGSEALGAVRPAVSSQLRGGESAEDVYLLRSRRHSNEFEDEE
ncbi:hypothetical protein THAOC_32317 [Thalassiosira oceanica]|uniref:Uncharacterized protein n=1 Tax=Thalassiosira oceanica TaxID=159749 RepID=K0RQ76_THAOC|nr:hypothetical protein THAOC_32317 [Thalassiosira oceanica]|eukprot:EJK48852.1 hypothetical protein THAOC_32317 [Thalassiosira oceanica]